MKLKIQAILASLSIGLLMNAAAASAGPPAGEAVSRAVEAFAEKSKSLDRSDRENYGRLLTGTARAALADIALSGMSLQQLQQLHKARVLGSADMNEEVGARLEALARDPGVEGAVAAIMRLSYLPSTFVRREDATDADRERAGQAREVHAAALRQVVDHPGLPEAIGGGEGGELFMSIRRVDREVIAASGPRLLTLASHIEPKSAQAGPLVTFFDTLAGAEDIDAADLEQVRNRIVAALREAQNGNEDESITRSLEYLEGAYARGELVGHASPPLDITWTNNAEPIDSIEDLKGKVVVIDFWATWCGPCVGSFPNVRELQARYEGYPVVILGVTSLQGSHIDRPEGAGGPTKRIDTKDDPAKEYELMNTFVEQLEMTWPVVFTSQQVFNPDYGVRGIPHVAILDPAGVVRYRGMHPASDKTGKHEKIDGLLREFNLPAPEAG
jgi:thiol-disulfide isomerase/thioredoxin